MPSPAERAALLGQAGAWTVWNVECKQSVLPATAQLQIPTACAVPRELQTPRSCPLELQPRGRLSHWIKS